MERLTGVRACVFDAYGTLFDVASAAARCPGIPDDRRSALAALWRDKQLTYTWLRTLQGRYADFRQVTGDALDFALETLELPADLRDRLMDLYRAPAAFPEVPETLRALRQAGFVTAIATTWASNSSRSRFSLAIRTRRWGIASSAMALEM